MMSKTERAAMILRNMPRKDAQEAVRLWASTEINARRSFVESMQQRGWQRVDVPAGTLVIGEGQDARPIMWVRDTAYALPPELHRQRRDLALQQAVERKKQYLKGQVEAVPGEALTSVLCPRCRSVMAKSQICPKCTDGRKGFKILATCTECGYEVKL